MSTSSRLVPLPSAILAPLVVLVALSLPREAHAAVSCSVTGYAKVEPVDTYYCDTRYFPCTGWQETDLYAKRGASAVPLRYLRVEVWQSGQRKGQDLTGATGYFTVATSLPGSSCNGQSIELRFVWQRAHETDQYLDPDAARYRFRLVNYANQLSGWYTYWNHNLTGSSTSLSKTFGAVASPPLSNRLAQLYYTANSAITTIVGWTTNLSNQFASTNYAAGGITRIAIGTGFATGGGWAYAAENDWRTEIAYDVFDTHGLGSIVRHELGHLTEGATHGKKQMPDVCRTDNFNFTAGRAADSCEYGSLALSEGLASFLGVSSIVSPAYNDAWECKCRDNTYQDICSHAATWWWTWDTEGDAETTCTGSNGEFLYIGDAVVDSTNDCVRLKSAGGCNCTQSGGVCVDAYRLAHGWRNTTQVTRFFWDMVDSNNEGQDDTDLSMAQLITTMEGMGCTGGDYGVDGSCKEYDRATVASCVPATNGAIPATFGSGTRDAHNIWDYAEAIAGDQTGERTLNCVTGAVD